MSKLKNASAFSYLVAILLFTSMLFSSGAIGLTFVLPHNGNIVGQLQSATIQEGDSLSTIGLKFDVGGYEMMEANPEVDYSHPKVGSKVIIPTRFVLPEGERTGIVINLAEMRLYYYHSDQVHVSTYPVGVGQEGWNTPLGKTRITRKREHPTWVVPESILENHLQHGQIIPKIKLPGPDNPLGDYAMNLGFESIVIHGTPYPRGVGIRSSHGCIRMLNRDVKELFARAQVGTPVTIIHQSNKIGRLDDKIYLEAHVPLSQEMQTNDYSELGILIEKSMKKMNRRYKIEWQEVRKLQQQYNGYPSLIGSLF